MQLRLDVAAAPRPNLGVDKAIQWFDGENTKGSATARSIGTGSGAKGRRRQAGCRHRSAGHRQRLAVWSRRAAGHPGGSRGTAILPLSTRRQEKAGLIRPPARL